MTKPRPPGPKRPRQIGRSLKREDARATREEMLLKGDGRALRAEGIKAMRVALLRPEYEIGENGRARPVKDELRGVLRQVDIIAERVIDEAKKGSLAHAKFAWESAFGRPVQAVEVDERESMTLVDLIEGEEWEET